MPKRKPLTESEWRKVFNARCQSKQGRTVSEDDQQLIKDAFAEDPERYAAMGKEVFNATVPFGSTTKIK